MSKRPSVVQYVKGGRRLLPALWAPGQAGGHAWWVSGREPPEEDPNVPSFLSEVALTSSMRKIWRSAVTSW